MIMVKHLASDSIDEIALSLDEDVYGANGDLTDEQIRNRLVANIHIATDHQYIQTGLLPARLVAALIKSVWEYEDRKVMKLLVGQKACREPLKPLTE
jgi:hypothetical protein